MAEKFSKALLNEMLAGNPFRKVMADCVMRIFSGTAPATGDLGEAGTLLCTISKASGVVSPGEVSTAKQATINVTVGTTGQTVIVAINGVDHTYTIPIGETGDLRLIGLSVSKMLDQIDAIEAVSNGGAADGHVYIRSRVPGLTFTVAKGGGGGGGTATWTIADDVVTNVRCDCLEFDAPTDGVISKPPAEVWSGVNAAPGTATHYRIVKSDDDGAEDTTKTRPRAQGSISTSGAELNLSSVNLAAGATTTIDSFSLTLPAQ
jgi:hypothetical protein